MTGAFGVSKWNTDKTKGSHRGVGRSTECYVIHELKIILAILPLEKVKGTKVVYSILFLSLRRTSVDINQVQVPMISTEVPADLKQG
jgi:hypothetical protein